MKRILLTSFLLGAFISIIAQKTPIRLSVQVSPQFAWLSSDDRDLEPDGSIFHMRAGLNMDYFFADNYAFSIGLGVNNLGGNLLYADSTTFSSNGDLLQVEPGQSVKLNLQYIDIPLGLKLKTEEMGYATFFFQLGFNPMMNINAKASSEEADLEHDNVRESTHFFCLGYHAGAGVEYKLGGNTAAVGGIRWTSGLTDITDNDNANIKVNALSIHLGILF